MYDRMSDRIVALGSQACYPAARLPALLRLGPATGVDTGARGDSGEQLFRRALPESASNLIPRNRRLCAPRTLADPRSRCC